MTVGELKAELEQFNDDDEVVMRPTNSYYVDGISYADSKDITALYDSNFRAVVLYSAGQVGADNQ